MLRRKIICYEIKKKPVDYVLMLLLFSAESDEEDRLFNELATRKPSLSERISSTGKT